MIKITIAPLLPVNRSATMFNLVLINDILRIIPLYFNGAKTICPVDQQQGTIILFLPKDDTFKYGFKPTIK